MSHIALVPLTGIVATPAPKLRWVKVDNTHILLTESDEHLVTEWRIVGYTLLRQVYEKRPAMWAVFMGNDKFPFASFDSLEAAQACIEAGAV